MLTLIKNTKWNDFSMESKQLADCGYIGYEFRSEATKISLSTALVYAISLMQKDIIHSIQLLDDHERVHFEFRRDDSSFNGNDINYLDHSQMPLYRFMQYDNIRFKITTYQLPAKHMSFIKKAINDFDHLLGYLSYSLITPTSKPMPSIKSKVLTIRELLYLINCRGTDFKINHDIEEENEELLEEYFEIEAVLANSLIKRLAQSVENNQLRIKAMAHLNEEETEFLVVTSRVREGVIMWDWDYEHEEFRFNSSPFDINKNYFRGVAKLSMHDLEKIRKLNGIEEVLQYLIE